MSDFDPAGHPARERLHIHGRPGLVMGGPQNMAEEATPAAVEVFTVALPPEPEAEERPAKRGRKAETDDAKEAAS